MFYCNSISIADFMKRGRENAGQVGVIGLGAMGMPMVRNLIDGDYTVHVFDLNPTSVAAAKEAGAVPQSSTQDVARNSDIVITMVPNDKVLRHVVKEGLLGDFKGIHLSCSTIHPNTARDIAKQHAANGSQYVGAPIFARADGVAKRQASFVVGGDEAAVEKVRPLLELNSNGIFCFGSDPGAGNVVKLCGNFMIASAIQSSAEALSLAEKSGLDRVKVMDMLSSTIFDCLIFRGYGMRTAHRQHHPGQDMVGPGFQLDLGLKDVTLALDVAHEVQSPMPFASVLHDRFLASQARGRGGMDWSALALLASEDAGVDVAQWLAKPESSTDKADK